MKLWPLPIGPTVAVAQPQAGCSSAPHLSLGEESICLSPSQQYSRCHSLYLPIEHHLLHPIPSFPAPPSQSLVHGGEKNTARATHALLLTKRVAHNRTHCSSPPPRLQSAATTPTKSAFALNPSLPLTQLPITTPTTSQFLHDAVNNAPDRPRVPLGALLRVALVQFQSKRQQGDTRRRGLAVQEAGCR
jgi:hypothetical protein